MLVIARLRPVKEKLFAPPSGRTAVTVAAGVPDTTPAVAVIEAEVADSGITTLFGVLSQEAADCSETRAPPAGAGPESATVQVASVPDTRIAGLQVRPVRASGAWSVTVAVEEAEPTLAVSTATWSADTAATFAVNWLVAAPAGTGIEPGTVTAELFDARATVVAKAAAAERVTVHCADPAPVTEPGVQLRPATVEGAAIVSWAVTVPPAREALIVPEGALLPETAFAVNWALVAPWGADTLAGTVTAGVEEVSAMLAPPVGAGPERVTVQAVCDPGVTVEGVQLKLATVMTG